MTTYESAQPARTPTATADCPISGGKRYVEKLTSMDAPAEFDDHEYPRT